MTAFSVKFDVPFREQLEFFNRKGYEIAAHSWKDVWKGANSRSFTVARVTQLDVLTDIRNELSEAMEKGETLEQFKMKLEDRLTARGWFAPEGEKAIITLPDGKTRKRLTGHRLDTIYRTNMATAYQAGRYKQLKKNAWYKPWWMYMSVRDAAARPRHADQHGKVYHFEHEYWDEWYPPNGFNCRCYVKSLSDRQLKEREIEPETEMPKDGRRPDDGWDYHVGKSGLDGWNPDWDKYAEEAGKDRSAVKSIIEKAKAGKQPDEKARADWEQTLENLDKNGRTEKRMAESEKGFDNYVDNYLSLLDEDRLEKERKDIIDRMISGEGAGNITRQMTVDGMRYIPSDLLADLERHGLTIFWNKGRGRASYNPELGKVDLFENSGLSTVAHECGHAVDSLISGNGTGFSGEFGHWKNKRYITGKNAKNYKSWFDNPKTGGKGIYENGDGFFWKGKWINDYEGRIYTGRKSFGEQYFAMGCQRYGVFSALRSEDDIRRYTGIDYKRFIRQLEEHLEQMGKRTADGGWDMEDEYTRQRLELAGEVRKMGAKKWVSFYRKRVSEWGRHQEYYPEFSRWIDEFFGGR